MSHAGARALAHLHPLGALLLGCVLAGLAVAADPAPAPPARAGAYMDDYAALNAKRKGVVTLPSGVQYEVLEGGVGRQPTAADAVLVSYIGRLSDGVVFDSSDEQGRPIRLPIGEVVLPGLREALLRMREGARWRVVVPPSQGFRNAGNNLLRKRDLIYEIELVSVMPQTAAAGPSD